MFLSYPTPICLLLHTPRSRQLAAGKIGAGALSSPNRSMPPFRRYSRRRDGFAPSQGPRRRLHIRCRKTSAPLLHFTTHWRGPGSGLLCDGMEGSGGPLPVTQEETRRGSPYRAPSVASGEGRGRWLQYPSKDRVSGRALRREERDARLGCRPRGGGEWEGPIHLAPRLLEC